VLDEHVHSGGMARVFRAIDLETQEVVAIKRPARGDDASLARFFEEAKILSELDHPAIVRAYSSGGKDFDDAHLVMEWLSGATLAECLVAGRLSVQEAVTVARRAAEALSAVHRAKIVHRDVKPTNLILCDGSPARTKLLDFGIARREATRGLSAHASFAGGTWAYMSPEQAMGSAELGARVDVYALGCVLFECLTGSPAFPSDRAQAVVAKVWQPPPNLGDFCRDLPAALLKIVSRALATDPTLRQRDGGALVVELLALGTLPSEPATLKVPSR